MTKEEQLQKMRMIAEEYKNTPDNKKCIKTLTDKYKTKSETIKKYFKMFGIEIITNKTTKNPEKTKIINIAVDEYINTPLYERSAAAIANKYGLNRKTIIAYAKDRGFTPTQHHNKPLFRYDVFDIIDSEDKAYWLGFLYADGYITSKNNHIGLSIALADIDHLKKFNDFLQYPKGLNIRKNGLSKKGEQLWICSTDFGDSHMWESLNRLGCKPNKSLILEFPKEEYFASPNLIRHFIRGYWDGDGSLGIYNNINYASVIGTKAFVEGVQKYCDVIGYIQHKANEHEQVHCLKYTNLKAFKVIEWLYKDATIYLERKYNIYLEMSRKELNSRKNRAKSGKAEIANP